MMIIGETVKGVGEYGNSVLSTLLLLLFCKYRTALKNKVYYLGLKYERIMIIPQAQRI